MATTARHLHDEDFYAWTHAQATALRRFAQTRPNLPLDLDLIAEAIEDLGMSERNAVFSFARLIMQHLLLASHSPAADRQRDHWLDEVDEFRSQIEDKLTPTIRRDLAADFAAIYQRARRNVARKMRRHGESSAAAVLPAVCPFTLDQILGEWEPAGHCGSDQ
jgi:hypothetical protein